MHCITAWHRAHLVIFVQVLIRVEGVFAEVYLQVAACATASCFKLQACLMGTLFEALVEEVEMQMDRMRVVNTESMEPAWVGQGTAVLILLHRELVGCWLQVV